MHRTKQKINAGAENERQTKDREELAAGRKGTVSTDLKFLSPPTGRRRGVEGARICFSLMFVSLLPLCLTPPFFCPSLSFPHSHSLFPENEFADLAELEFLTLIQTFNSSAWPVGRTKACIHVCQSVSLSPPHTLTHIPLLSSH